MSDKCKVCGFEGIKRFLTLGNIPPVNAFIPENEISREIAYPLNLAYCPVCLLVQLEEVVPPEKLFVNYLHLSAASASNVNHLKEVAEILNKRFKINNQTKILEIGSNDGTLPAFLKAYTPNVVGVDPAKNLIETNRQKGVDYIADFFNTSTASNILKTRGQFDLIVALNVIPHTYNVVDLLKGARIILSKEGTLIMEGVYALETILRGEFDTIYHEHVYTFSLHALIATFRMAGLKIVDIEKIPTQGGSLRVYAQKEESSGVISDSVKSLLEEERKIGLDNPQTYNSVSSKAENFKKEIRKLIDSQKAKHGKLIGLGAPARGVVILNYCKIGTDDLDYVVDDTTLKQNKVVPGMHIPVKSMETLKSEKKRAFLLLSWNYKDHFITKLKEMFSSFEIIVPFPKLEIISYP